MQKFIKEVTLGADPEVALRDVNNRVVPCYGIIPGTKASPFAINENDKFTGFSIQRDGFMAEFNIPPCKTCDSFVSSIQQGLKYLEANCVDGHKPYIISTYYAPDEQLEFPGSREFGCDPSFNVWTKMECAVPDADDNARYAGGHIHFGYKDPDEETTSEIIKILDLYLLIPSIILDPDTERREVYGQAGTFRMKEYGGEYRPLSNFWTASETLTAWVWEQTMIAIKKFNEGFRVSNELGQKIVQIVKDSDVQLAEELINKFNIIIPND